MNETVSWFPKKTEGRRATVSIHIRQKKPTNSRNAKEAAEKAGIRIVKNLMGL
jgi:hypothetical protein